MKRKIRIQKIFVILFLTFAVFNYNNCEVKVTKETAEEVQNPDENMEVEVGSSPVIGEGESESTEESGETVDSNGSGEIVVTAEENYAILLETYEVSQLYPNLKSNCAGCHVQGGSGPGPHASTDVEESLDNLLTHNTVGKVDLEETTNSAIYTKIKSNHYGIPVSKAGVILADIDLWVDAYNQKLGELIDQKQAENPEQEVIVETNVGDSDDTEESYLFQTDVQSLTKDSTGQVVFTIQNVGTLTVDTEYILGLEDESGNTPGFYNFKNPVLILFNPSPTRLTIKGMRGVLNESFSLLHGTWSSTDRTWSGAEIDGVDGVEIGYGTLFMPEGASGSDSIKFLFKEIIVN